MKDERRYYADCGHVYDRTVDSGWIASVTTVRLAKRIAAALNVYRPKVRRQKPAEKEVNSRPLSR